ncbi:hypothetical protein COT78_01720 [Candidatus Berkelbacteria bacterium CG10_big_fil_rev_8_21_14_0_10_43_13]|uniref:Ribosomal subunit interface protein n=1 Tax=Candidatus Berkelbacteria bacterium CG10_big_fil_rev_8_21_14_0_10_43_13 TaxID=1974514 RepID=A0A2H0W6V2_9BACT|nr:MAG: hypothetical protein COT78_01720 [Candidatus Berkelbacteria bacterium CG10_big_fil_rev_8_21_14_0_10_43_13]
MKIEFHIKDVVITAKQKALFEKKLMKLKKYCKDESVTIDVYLKDESSAEKGGVDQTVEISTVIAGEKIFVTEIDDRLLRAFARAQKAFDRQVNKLHKQRIEKSHSGSDSYISKALKALRLKK